MESLFEELTTGKGVASAFAFLASRIKDYGAVKPALTLYKRAIDIEAQNPAFALNYIHTLELQIKYNEILEFSIKFLRQCDKTLNDNIDFSELVHNLRELPAYTEASLGWINCEKWIPHVLDSDIEEIEKPIKKVMYSEQQLDMLAFIFTLVKVLFIGGALPRVEQILDNIEYARKCSKKELHTTAIRNETAYFSCIRQILREQPPEEIKSTSNLQPLYLCGDSHCLSAAWRQVVVSGKEHIVVPKLVTGCKVWHLRDESKFYPKVGYQRIVESIPKGSKVMMLLGEIDCREGIMLAVEKCKYDSDIEAIKATVNIYVKEIKKLLSERNFKVFVHPVPPVLDITRPVVKPFVRCLRMEVLDLAKKSSYKEKIHWLEFFDKLLTDDKLNLKPELSFDDTHLSPIYTSYLKEALLKI